MFTIQDAERVIRQHGQTEKRLKRFSIAILRQLCVRRGIQVDEGRSRLLKKPYIDALVIHVR
jgi:cyanophycinase-like exopeptidase